MESLKNAAVAMCMLSCAVSLVSLAAPAHALARQMKFLVSLLFAACLAVPLLHMELPSDPETLSGGSFSSQTQETENRVRESILRETQDYTAQALRQALANAGITCSELDVQVHIDESDCIHISKVTATCDDFAGANALLSDLLGGEGEIVVTQILRETQRP